MITPYYEAETWKLYVGDARLVVPALELKVDCILIDPPYAETTHAWDKWPQGWVAIARRALLPHGSMWCNGSFRMFMEQRDELLKVFKFSQDLIWEKHNGSNMFNDRFRRVHEMAVHFYPKDVAWEQVYHKPIYIKSTDKQRVNKRYGKPGHWSGSDKDYEAISGGEMLMRSVIYAKSMAGRTTKSVDGEKNDTQKPIDLLAPLLEYACPPGGTVLDMTCGSGSTLVLAVSMGYKAIGIDIRESQCLLAKQRLMGGPLFMGEVETPETTLQLDLDENAARDEPEELESYQSCPPPEEVEPAPIWSDPGEQQGLFGSENL